MAYDWTQSATGCIGMLDMDQITYSFDAMVPLYKTNRMTQEIKSIPQGSYGQVSEWFYNDGGNKVSVIVKIIDKARLVQKLRARGYTAAEASAKATVKFDDAINGLQIAKELRAARAISGFVNDTKLVTVMENLTQDAYSMFPQSNPPPQPEFKPNLRSADSPRALLGLKLIDFLAKLLQCLPTGVSYADMKLENIGYCSIDGEFRLLDIDSFNTNIATWGYLPLGAKGQTPRSQLPTPWHHGRVRFF